MKNLQVKYCHSEDELNEFLKTLYTLAQDEEPRIDRKYLSNIIYVPNVYGHGGQEYTEDGDLRDKVTMNSDIVAIVQYWLYW